MSRFAKPLAAVAVLALATGAQAGVLFSDSLQTTLAGGNWVGNTNGQIVASPVGGNALNFANTRSGSDLISKVIVGSGPGKYTLKVDYLCQNAGGCAGFIGLHPGGSVDTTPQSNGGDNWLVTDFPQQYGTPFTFAPALTGFVANTFHFTVNAGGPFQLKLEDFAGAAGDAYFRNLSLSVPEPASWALMVGGFGLAGVAMRRRKATVNNVYA